MIEELAMTLLALLTEISRAAITAYGVMEAVYVIGRQLEEKRVQPHNLIGAIGGALWIVGLGVWKHIGGPDGYTLSLLLRSWGVALMLLPLLLRKVEEHR